MLTLPCAHAHARCPCTSMGSVNQPTEWAKYACVVLSQLQHDVLRQHPCMRGDECMQVCACPHGATNLVSMTWIHARVCVCVHFSLAESHGVNAYLAAHSVCMWALARACACGAVVLRLHRHASVRSCVCVCVSVSVRAAACVCARTRRTRVCM